jgi:hypothetical protein
MQQPARNLKWFWMLLITTEHYNANVHRGIHTLSQVATEMMEDARKKVQHLSMQSMIMKYFL